MELLLSVERYQGKYWKLMEVSCWVN